MGSVFKFLKKQSIIGFEPSIEDMYDVKELSHKVVVRDEKLNKFRVFNSQADFVKWYADAQSNAAPSIHEVIFGWAAQRIKFDVDILEAQGADIAESLINTLIDSILEELQESFGESDIYPMRPDIAVTNSSGPVDGDYKHSYHLIVLPYAVSGNVAAQAFTHRVVTKLPEKMRRFVDVGVNKSIQNFRMLGSAKQGSQRPKVSLSEDAEKFGTALIPEDEYLFITASAGMKVLDDGKENGYSKDLKMTEPTPQIIQLVLEAAEKASLLEGHVFRESRGNLLIFDRTSPTLCRICDEHHHKDNTMFLTVKFLPQKRVGFVETCRHKKSHNQPLIMLDSQTCQRPSFIKTHIEALNAGRFDPHDSLRSMFEQLPADQRHVYAEPFMQSLDSSPVQGDALNGDALSSDTLNGDTLPDTLIVCAPMKSGKTKALQAHLSKHFPLSTVAPQKMCVITFRQTFSFAFARNFPGYKLYNDIKGEISFNTTSQLIIQPESLWRIQAPRLGEEPIDVLILDEVESIVAQFNSGLHLKFNESFAMFWRLLSTAKHVICMDANISDRTYRVIQRARPFDKKKVMFHSNVYRRAAEDNYFFTDDQGAWLSALHAAVAEGKKVVIPINNMKEARTIEAGLRSAFPGKSVALYSSETPPSVRALHFSDVHTYWKVDILIYTPTCTAGVSFELDHFDALYGFFTDKSCDVETCRQMSGRVRSLKDKAHFIYIKATYSALPTEPEDIRDLIYSKRSKLSIDTANLPFTYLADGTPQYYESDFFHLWIENTRITNLSINDFARRLISQIADTGASIRLMRLDDPLKQNERILSSHKMTKKAITTSQLNEVSSASVITDTEAEDIMRTMRNQLDTTEENKKSLKRWQLCEMYSWHDKRITRDFVESYQTQGARRVYLSLSRIANGRSTEDSLREIHKTESERFGNIVRLKTNIVNENRELVRDKMTYVYQAHYLANWFIQLCGFKLVGHRIVHSAELRQRLSSNLSKIKDVARAIEYEFDIRLPRALFSQADQFDNLLKYTNSVICSQYGVKIKKLDSFIIDGYTLTNNKVGGLFERIFPGDTVQVQTRPVIMFQYPRLEYDPVQFSLEAYYYNKLCNDDL